MQATFTHSPAETERKEPGIGGKPPVDRRPTGGGGGDDDWRRERGGPRDLLHRIRFFVFFGLAGDMVFFVMLVVLFFARQAGAHLEPHVHEHLADWRPVLLPPILFLNTAVLFLSSVTMEMARRSIFREIDVLEEWLGLGKPALHRALPWAAATLMLGGIFLAGQWVAWSQLTAQGFAFDRWSTPASYFFYLITGLHAAHLVLGLAILLGCLFAMSLLRRVELRQIAIDAAAWYWHAMGAAWIFLFAVLLLGE
jgi:cytochrome c oxidase subunit 3